MSFLERRRTERILAPIRIRVIGNDMSGVSFAEETVTVSFNQQGARISLIHSLLHDDVVLVKNLENGVEEEFRVVGAFQEVFGNRREWGVEALNPENGIWGVEFDRHNDSAQPKVLVECAACHTAAQSTLSSIEYEVLLATGLISRHCDRCNETTRWKPSAQAITEEILVRSQKAASWGHGSSAALAASSSPCNCACGTLGGSWILRERAMFPKPASASSAPSVFPSATKFISRCPMRRISPRWKPRAGLFGRRKAGPAGFMESNTFAQCHDDGVKLP